MRHPDLNIELTDAFGAELHVGDEIVYPVAHGSSSAELAEARIIAIVPLVRDPRSTEDPYVEGARNSNYRSLVREDQLQTRPDPTRYNVPTRYVPTTGPGVKLEKALDKAYVLVVNVKNRWGDLQYTTRKHTIKNVQNVIRRG